MTILFIIILMLATWLFFLAIMKLQDVYLAGRLTVWNRWPAYLLLLIGLVLDTALNVCMSVIMLDLPKLSILNFLDAIFKFSFEPLLDDEILLSPHVKRLTHSTGNSIRERYARGWARFICKNFLMPADPLHCGNPNTQGK